METLVCPELPTASVGWRQATTAAVDNSAPVATRPQSTYKSGKVVQTNGATSRTLMKDARRGLHSLVEAQDGLRNPVGLLELIEHSPAQVQTFHSSTIESSHGDTYNFNLKSALITPAS